MTSLSVGAGTRSGGLVRPLVCVFKLRIGLAIALGALAGYAVTPAPALAGWQVLVLALAVLVAASAGGAINQYVERTLDARMARTRDRPFVTGRFRARYEWPVALLATLAGAVGVAAWALNPVTALYVALGAFTYVVVYTIWLKPRTWWSIVIGGLAGSFAVLAGSAAASPELSPAAFALALVLFLWTPSHFWALAIALREEYAAAGIPMLPVVAGPCLAARAILLNTLALITAALLPLAYGLGVWYLAGALLGGAYLLYADLGLLRRGTRRAALIAFYASLVQLTLLLGGAVLDVHLAV
ncbi:MAG: protoheme IX farnesyltransferase [Gammaproteobacteria bacterium]|nr:protoheme IX farnesyltransferase [Gammaproteobacteria bacterium]NIR83826.1 protoheme IX farnesyltransferase [Gammaproteobacteria bacterium]NIV73433.1 protoheme IX farnesyltransferase [Gammaproteobacteria bacterium]